MENVVTKKRILSLEGVRALSFIGMMAAHCGFMASGIIVSIFIMLSGFLMTYSYYDRNINCNIIDNIKFSYKKLSLLILLNIFLITISMILNSIIFGTGFEFIKKYSWLYFVDIFMLQAWLLNNVNVMLLNGVSWYLSIAMFLYFVFPYILRRVKKYKSNSQASLVSIIVFLLQIALGILFTYMKLENSVIWCLTYVNPLFRLGDFIIGMNLCYIFMNIKKDDANNKVFSICEIVACVFVVLSYYFYHNEIGLFKYEACKDALGNIPFAAFIVFVFSFEKGIISRFLSNRFFKFIADVSPYGFLIHYQLVICVSIILSIIQIKPGLTFNSILFILVMCLTILFSKIYMRIIKK